MAHTRMQPLRLDYALSHCSHATRLAKCCRSSSSLSYRIFVLAALVDGKLRKFGRVVSFVLIPR